MSKAILGTKLGMSQVFAENGDLIPVSVIEVLPNVVAPPYSLISMLTPAGSSSLISASAVFLEGSRMSMSLL